jgi:histone-lysine N-methyltransferase SETD1
MISIDLMKNLRCIFQLDRSWVGVIPAKEVTFRNLNDNITKTFLTDICKRFGEIEDCKIYYDRQTKKHLGLGTVKMN